MTAARARVVFLPAGQEVTPGEGPPAAPIGVEGCLLGLAVAAGVRLDHACGGKARCGTCRLEVLEGDENLEDAGAEERALLEGAGEGWRLACRAVPASAGAEVEVVVRVPPRDRQTNGGLEWGAGAGGVETR